MVGRSRHERVHPKITTLSENGGAALKAGTGKPEPCHQAELKRATDRREIGWIGIGGVFPPDCDPSGQDRGAM